MTTGRRWRWSAAWVCLAALAGGCDSRALSWSYAPGAPGLILSTRTAAIAPEPVAVRGADEESREIVGSLAEELMRRGYSVVILEGAYPTLAVGGPAPVPPAPAPAQPTPTPAQPATPAASPPPVPTEELGGLPAAPATPADQVHGLQASRATPATTPPPPRVVITGSLPGRYAAAREARAGILIEVSAGVRRHVEVYEVGGPYGHYGYYRRHGPYWGYRYYPRETYVREYRSIPRATLRITNPADQTLLATVTVRYDSPSDRPADVAKDLALGFDFVRNAWPPQRITLKGPPEKVEYKTPPIPPPGAATQPTSQP